VFALDLRASYLARDERTFALPGEFGKQKEKPMAEVLSGKRQQILTFIADSQRDRGYPPRCGRSAKQSD